jgi:hypothetical protein
MGERDLAEWDRETEADFQRAVAGTRAAGKHKRQKEEPFVKVPLWWIEQAAKQIHSPATLVLVELLHAKFKTRSSTFTLSNARLQKLGVSRKVKHRILRNLAYGKGRMITVEQKAGRAPRISLIGL